MDAKEKPLSNDQVTKALSAAKPDWRTDGNGLRGNQPQDSQPQLTGPGVSGHGSSWTIDNG
jgi:hypothetical protein